MFEALSRRYHALRGRLRRLERRELRHVRRWLADTDNLLHLTALVIVPVLIGLITFVSNVSPVVSFLVYPPLASGTYTLFADPTGRYSSPRRFVGGMTIGALCGWVALEVSATLWHPVPVAQFSVHAGAAALGIFLTGIVTWGFDLEVPTAFSSALLVLVTGSEQLTYVLGLSVASLLVAGIFVVWRREFYHERARYLFQSTRGDDQILVPIREGASTSLALFAARLAVAHDAGKVVLMQTVPPEIIEETEADLLEARTGAATELDAGATLEAAEAQVADLAVETLQALQARIEREVEVPCEFVVAVEEGSPGETVRKTATAENCDLIVAPYETEDGQLSGFVRTILSGPTDAIVFRPSNGRTEWRRILLLVRGPGELANTMLDFADRLVPDHGTLSACTCIANRNERRRAEVMLENVVEPFADRIETRIATGTVESFLDRNAPFYDLAVIGASTDRSAASRFFSVPTFERISEVECDLAIVHRG